MKKFFPGRFGTLYVLFRIFIFLSFFTRIILLFYSASSISFHIWELVKSFAVGCFFDIIAFGYFMIPYVLFTVLIPSKISRTLIYRSLVWFFFSLTVFLLVFNAVAEYFFWDEFEVRYNFIAVDYLVYTNEVIGNIVESYSLPLLLSAEGIITALILWWVARKKKVSNSLNDQQKFSSRLITGLKLLIIPAFGFLFVNLSWSEVSANSYNKELAKNGIYSLFEAFKNNQLDYDHFYITVDDRSAFGHTRALLSDTNRVYQQPDVMQPVYTTINHGAEKKLNVMFITVESLSGEYMSYIKEPDEYETPFLDSLADHSWFFTNMYANGTRTVRGLEALNLSIPPTPGTSIVRRPNNEHLYSLGEIFKAHGYDNKFVYGGYGYFDNMNAFFSGNGFDIVDRSVLSKEEISFANVWGACDQDMYKRAIKEADNSFKNGKPFLNFIMTTSNHRPYTFPNVGIKLPDNRQGGVRYTDFALQWLMNAVKEKPWYANTIFIIVADHCGSSAGKTEIPILKYQIPCIIYAPGLTQPMKIDKLCSQVDVAPTLLSMLNWTYPSTFFGRDILTMKADEERAFIGTYQKLGYIKGEHLLVMSPQKKITSYLFNRLSGDMKQEQVNGDLQLDIVSLYQTAEHSFMKGLNKIKL